MDGYLLTLLCLYAFKLVEWLFGPASRWMRQNVLFTYYVKSKYSTSGLTESGLRSFNISPV